MKKIIRGIGKFFHHIGAFFDKWLITPITKLILKIIDFSNFNALSLSLANIPIIHPRFFIV